MVYLGPSYFFSFILIYIFFKSNPYIQQLLLKISLTLKYFKINYFKIKTLRIAYFTAKCNAIRALP